MGLDIIQDYRFEEKKNFSKEAAFTDCNSSSFNFLFIDENDIITKRIKQVFQKLENDILNVWGSGQLLAFSGIDGKTDYTDGLVARTSFQGTGIDLKLPAEGKIRIGDKKPEKVLLTGDFFIINTGEKTVKGAFVDTYHLLLSGHCSIEDFGPELAFRQNGEITLIGVKNHFNETYLGLDLETVIAERRRWLSRIKLPDKISGNSRKTAYKALSQVKTQIYTAEGQIKSRWTTPDRWPHRKMWLWDSAFHAIGLRHIDPVLTREALDAILGVQHEDGFIPLCAEPDKGFDITQPPVLALAVKLVNKELNNKEWLKIVYPKLAAYIKWDMNNRDSDGNGLFEWKIDEDVDCRSGESGMDNSPRFDSAVQLDAVDFNSLLALECEILAEFACSLGYNEEKLYWQKQHKRLCRLINEWLWSKKHEFYVDFDVAAKCQSEILASSGFLPLLCGAPTTEQAAKLVAHLDNPKTFKTPLPVASIAKSSDKYYSKDMWRGPVWINVNWLIAVGLRRYGYDKEADRLTNATTKVIEKMYLKYGTLFEFFDDRNEVDPPKLPRKSKNISDSVFQPLHDFGWTGTLYLDMVFSSVSNQFKKHG